MTAPDFEAESTRWLNAPDKHGSFASLVEMMKRIDAAGYARGVEDSAKVAEATFLAGPSAWRIIGTGIANNIKALSNEDEE